MQQIDTISYGREFQKLTTRKPNTLYKNTKI